MEKNGDQQNNRQESQSSSLTHFRHRVYDLMTEWRFWGSLVCITCTLTWVVVNNLPSTNALDKAGARAQDVAKELNDQILSRNWLCNYGSYNDHFDSEGGSPLNPRTSTEFSSNSAHLHDASVVENTTRASLSANDAAVFCYTVEEKLRETPLSSSTRMQDWDYWLAVTYTSWSLEEENVMHFLTDGRHLSTGVVATKGTPTREEFNELREQVRLTIEKMPNRLDVRHRFKMRASMGSELHGFLFEDESKFGISGWQ